MPPLHAAGRVLAAAFVVLMGAAGPVRGQATGRPAQTPTMPSTLRYGSGLLDIPVSSVLPHLATTATYSGFWVGLDRTALVDGAGNIVGFGPGADSYHWDTSVATGLFDRAEAGVAVQALKNGSAGGKVWGLFGRVRLWEPVDQGIGLAVGARYLTSPDFADGARYAPGRLGFSDPRLPRAYVDGTNLTAYGVATAFLRGFDAGGRLWENDVTFTLGYGSGMFKSGGALHFYGEGSANGWFYGTSVNMRTSPRSMLTVMAEHNGFDVNVGAQYDWDGIRAGVHWLASNHAEPAGGHFSEYQKGKVGFLVSVAVCPRSRTLRCQPEMMRRVEPDTIVLAAPPPDTVVVQVNTVSGPPPGDDVEICISTGQSIPLRVTVAGDTLVGPDYASLRTLRPALTFSGGYAGGAFWYEGNAVVTFEGADFGRTPDTFPIDCNQIARVGQHQGVPVFADRAAERPLVILFIPVRPGVWARYERGIR
ncbi:MAG: hypothetical protein ABL963_04805 [Longimicrobiales bacterium]